MQEPGDDDRRHWDAVYERAGPAGVSWYQPEAVVSLELIDRLAIPPDTPTIDVGGGASTLVDQLLRRGFSDLTVVDVSASALDTVRRRLGEDAHKVHLHRENVIHGWNPSRQYGLWHDRAVFHFCNETRGPPARRAAAPAEPAMRAAVRWARVRPPGLGAG